MIRKVMGFQVREVEKDLMAHLKVCGYECKPVEKGIKIFIDADGHQELKILLKEVFEITSGFDTRFLGYIG